MKTNISYINENSMVASNPIPSNVKGRNVKVALLDSGIAPDQEKKSSIKEGIHFYKGLNNIIEKDYDYWDSVGHGTVCSRIINYVAPGIELFPVRIFSHQLMTDCDLFEKGVEWCINRGVDIINVSLGTTNHIDSKRLQYICDKASEKRIIIIAAESNEGVRTYPASFKNVIGVTAGTLRNEQGFLFKADQEIEIVVHFNKHLLKLIGPKFGYAVRTSFAAPYITGIVALILEQYKTTDLQEIRKILSTYTLPESSEVASKEKQNNAGETDIVTLAGRTEILGRDTSLGYNCSWIKTAVLYPYDEEMFSLLNFQDLLPFEIKGVADLEGRSSIGKDAGKLAGAEAAGLIINNDLEKEIDKGDSIILGNLNSLSNKKRQKLLDIVFTMAMKNNKNIFSMGPLTSKDFKKYRNMASEKGLIIDTPSLSIESFTKIKSWQWSLKKIKSPVLGVFGTQLSKGKFEVQLFLRRWFNSLRYKICQMSTESQGVLFGFDYSSPYKCKGSVSVPLESYNCFTKNILSILDNTEPDIMIVGSKHSAVYYEGYNIPAQNILSAVSFLLATSTDVNVLVINPCDTDDHINDTINVIKTFGKGKVISIVIGNYCNEDQIEERIIELENRFEISVTEVQTANGQKKLIKAIIDSLKADNQ